MKKSIKDIMADLAKKVAKSEKIIKEKFPVGSTVKVKMYPTNRMEILTGTVRAYCGEIHGGLVVEFQADDAAKINACWAIVNHPTWFQVDWHKIIETDSEEAMWREVEAARVERLNKREG